MQESLPVNKVLSCSVGPTALASASASASVSAFASERHARFLPRIDCSQHHAQRLLSSAPLFSSLLLSRLARWIKICLCQRRGARARARRELASNELLLLRFVVVVYLAFMKHNIARVEAGEQQSLARKLRRTEAGRQKRRNIPSIQRDARC